MIWLIPSMPGLFSDAKPRELWKLAWPFLLSGCAGGVLMWFCCAYSGHEFLRALGDALVIAGAIGLSLELIAASTLIDHTSKELSSRLVGYGLPKQAQALINSLVHETKRVYRGYNRTFKVTRIDGKPGFVRIDTTVAYLVVNYGRGAEKYRPKLEESDRYLPQVNALQYGDHAVELPDLNREDHERGVTFTPKKWMTIVPSQSDVPLDSLRSDQKCFVRWSYSMEMPEHYSDVTAFTGVTINPTLELLGAEGFEFSASEDNNCRHVGSTWVYEQAFVAGQHVRTWWRPAR
jgi:hypothetical protein